MSKTMIVRQKSRLLKNSAALLTVLGVAGILAGCTTARSPFIAQGPLVTNSVNTAQNADLNQAMPAAVGAMPSNNVQSAAPVRVAQNNSAPFTPPADVGGSPVYSSAGSGSQDPLLAGGYPQTQASNSNFGNVAATPSQVSQQPLPSLSPLPVKSNTTMTASTSPAEIQTQPQTLQPPATQTAATPRLVPENAFMHKIEAGESLYVIARRYDVSPQAIVTANGLASADRIFVGQELIIPGRPDLIAQKAPAQPAPQKVAEAKPVTEAAQPKSDASQISPTPIARPSDLNVAAAPAQETKSTPQVAVTPAPQAATNPAPKPDEIKTASVPEQQVTARPQAEPQAQGFRWPVSGRLIRDFKASKNTGINIEAPEGTSVKAADSGTVIYTGNAVEGYGNLVLIKHANGYVSAYAHLKDISVSKGAQIGRGEEIGLVGFTGSVSRPQLHFELRKGATPVDPAPLLAS
ncbi:peptidoglycan DD-metalloendopeptidase family protein [Maritalea mediterranea]|uniref:Peptidoglycan DD-metalloendopeptidase family protein n=1 Tax=Maritalea mediterranea TaxID=2909667 RepID=A0ABS9E7W2_9HYPH|nr:peptidoglycan DD-metalloendopeptidase family protein [Maritalea mediterranea]MCF4098287.1 peptidoglycan DD-metalloendopeptidase family protein [Maritalea mediterranea]